MALFHFHVNPIGRAKGYSAVAAAAYRSGEKLYDDYYGETHDYTKKGGVMHAEIMAPDHVPERLLDRSTLWNELESVEKHPKAQLAYSFDMALQNELSMEENIAVAKRFIAEELVARGMICDIAVHMPGKGGHDMHNPHIHVLSPIRPFTKEGKWGEKQHRVYALDEDGNRIKDGHGKHIFNAVKTNDWGEAKTLGHWRKRWAEMINEEFEKRGIPERIDHRSYVDRGLGHIVSAKLSGVSNI